jgi:hypothetical protein
MDKNMETPREMRAWIDVFILATFVGDAVVSVQYHYLYNLRNTLQAPVVVKTAFCAVFIASCQS